MLLTDKSGIACDYCGVTYKADFTYCSWDFRRLSVFDDRRPSLDQIFSEPVTTSIDICEMCFANFQKTIVANYKKIMSERRQSRQQLICEWTGTLLNGTFDYYHVNVTKVQVRITGQPSICTQCQTRTVDESSPCKHCGKTAFMKIAAVNTVQRMVELNLSQAAYDEFMTKAGEIQRSQATAWSTK